MSADSAMCSMLGTAHSADAESHFFNVTTVSCDNQMPIVLTCNIFQFQRNIPTFVLNVSDEVPTGNVQLSAECRDRWRHLAP